MSHLDATISAAMRDIADQQDSRIIEAARSLDMTIEQFAAEYAIEYTPVEFVEEPGYSYRATCEMRFVRRAPDGEPTP